MCPTKKKMVQKDEAYDDDNIIMVMTESEMAKYKNNNDS